MANISKMSVLLGASIAGFSAQMKVAGGDVTRFGETFKKAAGFVAGAGAALGLAGSVEGIVEYVKTAFEAADSTAKFAKSMGVSTESLSRLQYAGKVAGASVENVRDGIQHMERSLFSARTGAGEAASTFMQLGLDAKELAKLPADQAMEKIADKLNSVNGKSIAAGASLQIFGKSSAGLIPLLQEGSEGIEKLGQEADKTGNTLSAVDASQILLAGESMRKMESVLEGIGTRIAVGIAPYLDALSQKFVEMANAGNWSGKVVMGMEAMGIGIAYTVDAASLLKAGFYGWRAAAVETIGSILDELDALGQGIVDTMNLLPKVHLQWTSALSDMAKGMHTVSTEEAGKFNDALAEWASHKTAAKVETFFDDIRKKAEQSAAGIQKSMNGIDLNPFADKLNQMLLDIEKKRRQIGMTEGQKMLDDLKEFGASESQLSRASVLQNGIEQAEAHVKALDELRSKAKSVFEESQTPIEKYQEKLRELNEMLSTGLLDPDHFTNALNKAKLELQSATASHFEAPRALEAGSRQAADFIAQFQARDRGDDVQTKILKENTQTNKLLGKLIDVADKKGGMQIGIVDFT